MEFKILLVGDSKVGKSSFLKRHQNMEFGREYLATQGADVTSLSFNTNHGLITFNVWDCSGQQKFDQIRDGYYYNTHGVIIMFDLGNEISNNNVNKWLKQVKNITNNIPVIICGNKYDLYPQPTDIDKFSNKFPYESFCISTKTGIGCKVPFLYLIKELIKQDNVEFIDIPELIFSENNKKITLITQPNGGIIKITYEFFDNKIDI